MDSNLDMNDPMAVEAKINQLIIHLQKLRRSQTGNAVPDYEFKTLDGEVRLSKLFGDHDKLLVIHNMGTECSYCTMWADGFNGLLPHLENALSVAFASKDEPSVQKTFADSRGWKFRRVSHHGKPYAAEQTSDGEYDNCPGAVVFERKDGQIFLKSRCEFGPDDIYCPTWTLLGMAGIGEPEWAPKFSY